MSFDKYDLLVVEDHYLVVEGIYRIIERVPEVQIADVAYSGEKAMELINRRDYDLFLLDIELKDMTAFELIDVIRSRQTDARIIINTMHEEIWIINQLIKANIDAIILKNSNPVHLVNAINKVLQGLPYTCPRFGSICEQLEEKKPLIKDIPTKREIEIISAMSEGLNTREISEKLNITENTVETFRKRLMQKLNAKNAVEIVTIGIRKGWIDL